MDKILRNSLASLGCDDKQIRLFLACYQHGAAPLSELAKAARLPRATAYVVAKELLTHNLLTEDHKAYGKTFAAIPPETLARMVAAKQRQIGRQHIALTEHLGELEALYAVTDVQPKVKTYQGANGLLSVWRDILAATGEILIWTNQATETMLFSQAHHDQFIAERARGNHFARVLAVNNDAGIQLWARDAESLRETRLLAPGIEFNAETYIYDNKVAMLDYDQDIIGIITESKAVAESHRAMFEAAWQSAQSS